VEIKGLRGVKERARSDTTENVCTYKEGCMGQCKNTRITVVIKVGKDSCKMFNIFVRF
jgi:hypothetical protein